MTIHHLPAEPHNLRWGAFSAGFGPVLEVDPGDRVVVDTIHGGPDQIPEEMWSRLLPEHRLFLDSHAPILPGHILTGPIGVRGALPGDTLEIRIIDVTFRQDWAWNMIWPLRGALPEDFPDRRLLAIELDTGRGTARLPWGTELPLDPFMGVLGVTPPAAWGTISSISPGQHGGNLDIKELRPGSILYLPVLVPGAGLMVGDGHALQADGESCLSAAETSLSATLDLHLRRDLRLWGPRAETPTHHITIGIDPDLDDAARHAVRDMIGLVRTRTGLSAEDAYTLCSLAADVHVSQLVNLNKGCHVMLPKAALENAPQKAPR